MEISHQGFVHATWQTDNYGSRTFAVFTVHSRCGSRRLSVDSMPLSDPYTCSPKAFEVFRLLQPFWPINFLVVQIMLTSFS